MQLQRDWREDLSLLGVIIFLRYLDQSPTRRRTQPQVQIIADKRTIKLCFGNQLSFSTSSISLQSSTTIFINNRINRNIRTWTSTLIDTTDSSNYIEETKRLQYFICDSM